jgi:hypothetical protein
MELFRAYSDSSQGNNSKDLFAPGAAVSFDDITTYTPPSLSSIDLAQELVDALKWSDKTPSKFIFFTASLLFATQLARFRTQKGEDNVSITCFDPKSAHTPAGGPVRFWSVSALIKQYGIVLKNEDGSIRNYGDVYVAMDCVIPGVDALTASFDEMESAGLYRLYKAMAGAYQSHRPRLALTTQDLREYHFQEDRGLTAGYLNVAAKVAAVFKTGSTLTSVPSNVLAHVLALRKRQTNDPVLLDWLRECSTKVFLLDDDDDAQEDASEVSDIPEIDQCRELKRIIGDRRIDAKVLGRSVGISEGACQQDYEDWEAWRSRHINEYREARQQRPGYVPKTNSRKRHHHNRNDPDKSGLKRTRRDGTAWLPRAEYEAERDAKRAS